MRQRKVVFAYVCAVSFADDCYIVIFPLFLFFFFFSTRNNYYVRCFLFVLLIKIFSCTSLVFFSSCAKRKKKKTKNEQIQIAIFHFHHFVCYAFIWMLYGVCTEVGVFFSSFSSLIFFSLPTVSIQTVASTTT